MKLKLTNACSSRGADMGRPNLLPDDCNAAIKLHLERLRWVDGDYDAGSAYWGGGSGDSIYCGHTVGVQVFVRAKNHNAAKAEVRTTLPAAKFYR
jgi:hypothetical protein